MYIKIRSHPKNLQEKEGAIQNLQKNEGNMKRIATSPKLDLQQLSLPANFLLIMYQGLQQEVKCYPVKTIKKLRASANNIEVQHSKIDVSSEDD